MDCTLTLVRPLSYCSNCKVNPPQRLGSQLSKRLGSEYEDGQSLEETTE
jgi:hypothetical protein